MYNAVERMRDQTEEEIYGEIMKEAGYEIGPKCCAVFTLASIAGVALFIIGCIGAAGVFPGSTIGWVTVGLAGGGFALLLSLGHLKKRAIELITSGLAVAVYVTVGALGGMGVLSATQVGWGIIGTSLGFIPINRISNACKKAQLENQLWEKYA